MKTISEMNFHERIHTSQSLCQTAEEMRRKSKETIEVSEALRQTTEEIRRTSRELMEQFHSRQPELILQKCRTPES